VSDTQQTVGTVGGIVEKPSGWYEVQVEMPGKQYPLKLSTKKSEIIDAVRGVGADIATFTYNEVESDRINEHTGKPYVNRYLEGVTAGGSVAVGGRPIDLTQTTHAPVLGGDKDRAITRMAVLKAAAQIVAGRDYEDPGLEVMKQASRFETWIYRDLEPPPFE
jgi:hypothetical protein